MSESGSILHLFILIPWILLMFENSAHEHRGRAVETVKFVRWMSGGSGAFLARDDDGIHWVVKLLHNQQGNRVLSNELWGALLLRSVGLPSLPWKQVRISKQDARDELIGDRQRLYAANRFDTHFASLFIGEPDYITAPLGHLPDEPTIIDALTGMYVFDLWAAHVDRRELLFAYHRQAKRTHLFAIDNGHLFYGPEIRTRFSDSLRMPLGLAMYSVIAQNDPLHRLSIWVDKLQLLLPSALSQLLQARTCWGSNELTSNRQHFEDRLSGLASIVRANWELQVRALHLAEYHTSVTCNSIQTSLMRWPQVNERVSSPANEHIQTPEHFS